MRIIAKRTLIEFWNAPGCADAEGPLKSWYMTAKRADWATPRDIKRQFGNASIIGNNRVVFNIAGNKYRLIVQFNYAYRVGYVRFVGTHKQYDRVNAEEI